MTAASTVKYASPQTGNYFNNQGPAHVVNIDSSQGSQTAKRKMEVLVAEDDKMIRMFINRTIVGKAENCNIEFAEDGVMAVEKTNTKQYDLIFMDCHMPNMNGPDAVQLIRKSHPTVPIVVQSSENKDYLKEVFGPYDVKMYLEEGKLKTLKQFNHVLNELKLG